VKDQCVFGLANKPDSAKQDMDFSAIGAIKARSFLGLLLVRQLEKNREV